jgi:predicted DNA binding CopG/RHH family protein
MKKDLEAVLSDGVAEIEFNGSEIDMAKEYEASQDYDAEKDAEAIRKYFKKKGVSLKKDDIEIEKFDDYISLTLNKNINETFVQTKKIFNEERRLYVESIAAVKKKAEKTGMPYSILKQVYDRGMAAWKGGHRPGATQVQWALARVNSFVTKSSGTWGGADKDLAAKVKGSK